MMIALYSTIKDKYSTALYYENYYEDQLNVYVEKVNQLNSNITELQQMVDKKSNEIEKIKTQNQELENKIKEKTTANQELEKNNKTIKEQIIDLKDNLIKYGLKDGIKKSIDDAINVGKSAIGIVTGKFDNISQMQEAVKNGGIIDNVSYLLDDVINKVKNAGLINSTIANTIKKGKNSSTKYYLTIINKATL